MGDIPRKSCKRGTFPKKMETDLGTLDPNPRHTTRPRIKAKRAASAGTLSVALSQISTVVEETGFPKFVGL